jgi:DNA-binding NarL/FixJ family response regulator
VILFVDDDVAFTAAAKAMLGSGESIQFASDYQHATDMLAQIGASRITVALVDLDLPQVSGFDLIHRIHLLDSKLPVIAMSGVVSEPVLESARLLGATAILRKPISDDWRPTIDLVRRRETSQNGAPERGEREDLTPREKQVLALIAQGESTKEVAQALGISFKTVACHRGRIMRKLDAHKATDLTRHAIRMGLVQV